MISRPGRSKRPPALNDAGRGLSKVGAAGSVTLSLDRNPRRLARKDK
jgi:hypothetical protein